MKHLSFYVLLLAVLTVYGEADETIDLDTEETNIPVHPGPNVEGAPQPVEPLASEASVEADPEVVDFMTEESEAPIEGETETTSVTQEEEETEVRQPVQSGPLIDLLGPQLLSLSMVDETHAQLEGHLTSDALRGKKVIGLYFSADWCGPCRQFTPELVSFYQKIKKRRGKQDQFEIVWVSRCRDVQSFGQYFTQMGGWYALPPEEAMGERGAALSDKYRVKSIPTLVLLDDMGGVITTDGRNKIPQDKAGIGFPWRNPVATLYMTLLPRSLRLMVRSKVSGFKDKVFHRIKSVIGLKRPTKLA